jgi:hypothetical protein
VTSLQSGLIGGTLAPLVGEQPQPPQQDTPQSKTAEGRPPFTGPGSDAQGDKPNIPCETQRPIRDLSAPSTPAPQQYPITGTLPTSLVQQLLSAIPIPLPGGLSRDARFQKIMHSQYKPLTPAQRMADISFIRKYGLWDIFPSGTKVPTANSTKSTTRRTTRAKASSKR